MIKPASQEVDLRRGVDYTGVTVSFIVHDGKGKALLQKRSQQCRDERGKWDIGGGSLEFGEKIQDGVIREIKEELGVKPLEVKFIRSGESHRINDGQPTHWIWLLHAVKVNPAKVKINEPHKIDELGWFTSKDLPKPPHSMLSIAITIAKQEGLLK